MVFVVSKLAWFLLTPSNLLTFLAATGLVAGAFRGRRRFWLALSALSVAGLLAFGLTPVSNALIAPLENRFPQWQGPPPDGIVVLGGAVTTRVSGERKVVVLNESAERMTAMIALALRYPKARIVFSGGTNALFGHRATEAEMAGRLLAESGLDPERLILEDRARNTQENALFSRALAAPRPGERWLLVTSAYHMPRAVGAFRAAGFPVEAYPVDYRTSGPGAVEGFASVADGLKRADIAAKEWLGLLAYRATGRIDTLFPEP